VGAFVAVLNKTAPALSLGVVMSASHNKIVDNGVKITNFAGNML
jgi:phosphomannomutase